MLLERAGIAYTGSPPLALGLALHKHKAKAVLRGAGVPTPDGVYLASPTCPAVTLPFPLIVKPSREDASTGISSQSVVHDRAELGRQVAAVIARYRQPALVERYIEGREIYVSMLGRRDGGHRSAAAARDRLLGDARRPAAHRLVRGEVGGDLGRIPRHEAGAAARA